jgi:hypothetical protein
LSKTVRVQLDLQSSEAAALDELKTRCGLSSRKDAIKAALAVIDWVKLEASAGRRIMAIGPDYISQLAIPGVTTLGEQKQEG